MGVRDHRRCEAAVRRSRVGQDSLDPAASPLSRRKGKDEEGSCPLDGTGPRGWPSDRGEQPWRTRRNIADRRIGTDDDRPEGAAVAEAGGREPEALKIGGRRPHSRLAGTGRTTLRGPREYGKQADADRNVPQ